MNTENAVRAVVLKGLSHIPEVGGIISKLTGILWPASKEDVWSKIYDGAEAFFDKKLSETIYKQVKDDLTGLSNVLKDYSQALRDSQSNTNYISEKYNVALGHFETAQPHFMSEGYEILLLPLLAQMANLHLALLQDGANFGKDCGWTPKIQNDMKLRLQDEIKKYESWVIKWYQTGYNDIKPQAGEEVWTAHNRYVRGMNLQVLDISFYWPFFAPGAGKPPKQTREIFSDPQGFGNDNPINLAQTINLPLTKLSIWGYDRIDAVQQAFGNDALGPRMGNSSGGKNAPPYGWTGLVSSSNPVVEVSGLSGAIVNSLRLKLEDGTETNECGGRYSAGDSYSHQGGYTFSWKFEGQILSRVYITGKNDFYGSAEKIILGFRFEDSY